MNMPKCPSCKKETNKLHNTWKYGHFEVQAYLCPNCGMQFREYNKNGKPSFTLMLKNGKYRKV